MLNWLNQPAGIAWNSHAQFRVVLSYVAARGLRTGVNESTQRVRAAMTTDWSAGVEKLHNAEVTACVIQLCYLQRVAVFLSAQISGSNFNPFFVKQLQVSSRGKKEISAELGNAILNIIAPLPALFFSQIIISHRHSRPLRASPALRPAEPEVICTYPAIKV